jgi:hypothetical protein
MAFIFSILFSLLHPFFVSVIDVKHNVKDKNVEVSIRIFVDDFEATLKKNYQKNFDLNKSANDVQVNKLITNYIQSKLQIVIDGKPQTMQYLGFEVQKESVWIFLEINNVQQLKKINFNCNLLYDFQDKQMNIFNVKANGIEKNYKLDYPKSSLEFVW